MKRFKPSIYLALALVSAGAAWGQAPSMPDHNLAAALLKYVPNAKPGDPVTQKILDEAIYLRVGKDTPVADLSGLDKARNLTTIFIDGSPIADLSPLRGLVKLEALTIRGGKVRDLSPLAGLKNLNYLDLSGNEIADLKPLAGLKKLEMLYLSNNKIGDLASAMRLENLQTLYVDGNQISDVAPLVAMTARDWTISLAGDPLSGNAKANELPQLRKHALDVVTSNR